MPNLDEIFKDKRLFEEFLKEKGFKINNNYVDKEFPNATFYELGQNRLLAIEKCHDEEKIKIIKDHFLIEKGLSHCALILKNKIIICRNYGDRKYFIFSDRTKNNISKRNKLEKIKEDIDIIFHAKDISKIFYDAFKKRRDFMVQKIEGKLDPIQKFLIAQKIFDRIFFIYFLCHKDIVKFKDGQHVSGKNLFRIINEDKKTYENIIKLFSSFNSEKNILKINNSEFFIPYLNGGIFRIDLDEAKISISISKKEWDKIFDFLNGYHWIIEDDIKSLIEEESDDLVLTPEILGHIYERSVVEWELKGFETQVEESVGILSERKKKGVYYTPENITEFICLNSLNQYISKKINVNSSEIQNILYSTTQNQYKKLLDVIDTLRIIDPACGSGAFLVKMADILFRMKVKILSELNQPKKFYEIKKEIITNNIFGIDILQGATEIAKLRLWLWLVSSYSEENEIQPLPNMEYNIIVGNSLIGWYDEKIVGTFETQYTEGIRLLFLGLITHCNKTTKKIYEHAEKLLQTYNLDSYIDAYSLLHDVYKNAHGDTATALKIMLTEIKKYIYKSTSQSLLEKFNEKIPLKNKILLNTFEKLNPFHWKFDFGDINKETGFDIVIGNPPYGDTLTDIEKKIIDKTYDYKIIRNDENGKSSSNSSAIFLERVFKILKPDGVLGFIVPSSIARTQEFSKLRKFLRMNSIKKLSEVGKAFPEVGLEMLVMIIQKSKQHEKTIILSQYTQKSEDIPGKFEDVTIDYSIYDSRDIFLTMINMEKYRIIESIERNSVPLESLGIMPRGYGSSSLKFYEKPSSKSTLFLGGANIFRFGLKDGPQRKLNRYLDNNNDLLLDNIFQKNRIIYQNVASSLPKIIAMLECNRRPTDDTVNNLILKDESLLKPVLLILNSNLTTFYLKYALINCSKLTVHLDKPYLGNLRIIQSERFKTLTKISDYLILLNSQYYYLTIKDKDVTNIVEQILFLQKIGNFLIYEIYFQEKFDKKISHLLQNLEEIQSEKTICTGNKNDIIIETPKKILEKITKNYNLLKDNSKLLDTINELSKERIIQIFEAEAAEIKIA